MIENELRLIKRRTLYAQVFGTADPTYRRASLPQDTIQAQSSKESLRPQHPGEGGTESQDLPQASSKAHLECMSLSPINERAFTPTPDEDEIEAQLRGVSIVDDTPGELSEDFANESSDEQTPTPTTGDSHKFWALVQLAVDKVVAREAVREREQTCASSTTSMTGMGSDPSLLAVECAMDMPETSPLSDPQVLDVLFEDESFVKLCHGEKVEVQGRGGAWEWWFDGPDIAA